MKRALIPEKLPEIPAGSDQLAALPGGCATREPDWRNKYVYCVRFTKRPEDQH